MFSILIVDDEPLIAGSLSNLLKQNQFLSENCEIHLAYNAYEAQFLAENESIDVILSDVNMPGMNGIALRDKLLEEGRPALFVFISGYNEFDNIYQAMKQPDTKFLLKSEPDEEIIKAVLEQVSKLKDRAEETVVTEEGIIAKIDSFLLTHLRDEGCLTAVADYIHVNPTYLSRLYKQLTGTNFSKRVCQMKIDRAKELLETTSKRVQDIGNEVGFVSSSAFVYFFKKNTGITPKQYQTQLSGHTLKK